MGVLLCGYLHCFKYIVLKTSIESLVMLIHTVIPRYFFCFGWFRISSAMLTSVTTPIFSKKTVQMGKKKIIQPVHIQHTSGICFDLQDVQRKCCPPFFFHLKQKPRHGGIIGMVVSCCDAIGNVLITSFWSPWRAHPCILWRSKLRNTYRTLDFAKDCFRIST